MTPNDTHQLKLAFAMLREALERIESVSLDSLPLLEARMLQDVHKRLKDDARQLRRIIHGKFDLPQETKQ